MSKNAKWKAYLDERPEFRKWCEYQQNAIPQSFDRLQYIRFIRDNLCGDEVSSLTPDTLLKMSDGQILECAAAGGWEHNCSPANIVIRTGKKIPIPEITFDEALASQNLHEHPMHNTNHCDTAILDILCAREMGTSPYDQKTTDKANITCDIMWTNPSLVEDMDSFIRFSCEYDHAYMFGNHIGLIAKNGTTINNDFIDRLLEPKPDPSEISEDEWNDRSRVLTGLTDSYATTSRIDCSFIYFLLEALSAFFNRNQENIVFVETVYDFIMNTLDTTDMDTVKYRPGILDMRIFDSLRTYGASFAAPFLERAYDAMK